MVVTWAYEVVQNTKCVLLLTKGEPRKWLLYSIYVCLLG